MEKTSKNWKSNSDTSTFADTFYEYIRHWKYFLISVLTCLLIGTVLILTTQRKYKTTLSILLNEDKNPNKKNAEIDLESLGVLSTTNNIENEMALLSSPDLMRQVVDSLNLQTTYFIRERMRNTEIQSSSPFRVSCKTLKKKHIGKFQFYIQKQDNSYDIYGSYTNIDGKKLAIDEKTTSFPHSIVYSEEELEITIELTNKAIRESEKYYILVDDTESVAESLASSLTVSPASKNSSVLNLSLSVSNTEKGSIILSELVKQYNEMNIKLNNEMAYNTSLFINERLGEIAVELSDVEKKVVDYKRQNNIADLGTEAQFSVQQAGLNEHNLMNIETQLGTINMVENFIKNSGNKSKLIPNIGISDATLAKTITEYNEKLLAYDILQKSVGEEYPTRKRATEDIENMRNGITSSLQNVKQAYQISRNDLLKQSYTTQSRIKSMPMQERGLLEKEREQKIKESLFLFLMQKREETNLMIASTADKARIIVSPKRNIPQTEPKAQIILLSMFALGMALPILVIYGINLFKTRIRNRAELEKLTNLSVVGQIGKNENKNRIAVTPDTRTGVSEMFRSLRNNVDFIFKHKNNKIILVTSTIAEEGKTFISLNLALSFALTQKRVLLIGTDIRKPKLRSYVNQGIRNGLTNYLVDNNDNWKEYINQSTINPQLDIMIGGTIPPNPNELLMSDKLKTLMEQVKNEYDMIVLDSAPVGMVSDTYLISEFVDMTLYIIREGHTPRAAINFVDTQGKEGKLNNMYLVLNNSSLDNHYRYGYGKEYGYEKKSR